MDVLESFIQGAWVKHLIDWMQFFSASYKLETFSRSFM